MKRYAGPVVVALAASMPALLRPGAWPIVATLAGLAVALAAAAVALRTARPVVWAVILVCVDATVTLLEEGKSAYVWALSLALLLMLGAELTYAGAHDAGDWPWRREHVMAALVALVLTVLGGLSIGMSSTLSYLGIAAIGVLVMLLALLVVRSAR
jgi:hypothetical protein